MEPEAFNQLVSHLLDLGPMGVFGAAGLWVGKYYVGTLHQKLDKLTDSIQEVREDLANLKGRLGDK